MTMRHVVIATDDAYARPAAVVVRSLAEHAPTGTTTLCHVLDVGVSSQGRHLIEASLPDDRCSLVWESIDAEEIRTLPVPSHLTTAAYARLLLTDVLPASVTRAVYLDADVLVRRDLGPLFDLDLAGATAGAVIDEGWPIVSDLSMPPPARDAYGIALGEPYFNSGVLVVDLPAWQAGGIGVAAIDVKRRFGGSIPGGDQGALNIALRGRWCEIHPRWNQQIAIYAHPTWRGTRHDRSTYSELVRNPAIVHFVGDGKPWHRVCPHPFADEWRKTLARTAFGRLRTTRTNESVARDAGARCFAMARRGALRNRSYRSIRPIVSRIKLWLRDQRPGERESRAA